MGEQKDAAAVDAYDDLYSPGWRTRAIQVTDPQHVPVDIPMANDLVVGGRRNGKLLFQRQVEILEQRRDELLPLLMLARNIARHVNRDADLLLLPEAWGLDPLLVNSGRYLGFELRIAPVDKPMLAYATT